METYHSTVNAFVALISWKTQWWEDDENCKFALTLADTITQEMFMPILVVDKWWRFFL